MCESQNSLCTEYVENSPPISAPPRVPFFFFPVCFWSQLVQAKRLENLGDCSPGSQFFIACFVTWLINASVVRLCSGKATCRQISSWCLSVLFFVFLMDNFIKPQGWGRTFVHSFLTSTLYRHFEKRERSNFMEIFMLRARPVDACASNPFNLPEILLPPWWRWIHCGLN